MQRQHPARADEDDKHAQQRHRGNQPGTNSQVRKHGVSLCHFYIERTQLNAVISKIPAKNATLPFAIRGKLAKETGAAVPATALY
jgi:hypothetical protein